MIQHSDRKHQFYYTPYKFFISEPTRYIVIASGTTWKKKRKVYCICHANNIFNFDNFHFIFCIFKSETILHAFSSHMEKIWFPIMDSLGPYYPTQTCSTKSKLFLFAVHENAWSLNWDPLPGYFTVLLVIQSIKIKYYIDIDLNRRKMDKEKGIHVHKSSAKKKKIYYPGSIRDHRSTQSLSFCTTCV